MYSSRDDGDGDVVDEDTCPPGQEGQQTEPEEPEEVSDSDPEGIVSGSRSGEYRAGWLKARGWRPPLPSPSSIGIGKPPIAGTGQSCCKLTIGIGIAGYLQ